MGTCQWVGLAAAMLALSAHQARSETTQLTIYRITPRNYTGITNLDTGDAAGDAFFGLYEKSAPVVCRHDSTSLLCTNEPLLQIPGFNVYIKVLVEADTRFGDYAECNPSAIAPHAFNCTHFSDGPKPCWNADPSHPQWRTDFAGLCDPAVCTCDVIEAKAVGKKFPLSFAPKTPPGTPQQCIADFYSIANVTLRNESSLIKRISPASLADCCAACSALNNASSAAPTCGLYSFTPQGAAAAGAGSCELHTQSASGRDFAPTLNGMVGFFSGSGVAATVGRATAQMADILNGTWYSTQAAGKCNTTSDVLGRDCWWREVSQLAAVNATCVNERMIRAVVSRRPACFNACADPSDESSDCWVSCFFETIAGNSSALPPVPSTPREVILSAFESAFDAGVCPTIPPCGEPCLPPCWAVPKGDPCVH